MKSIALPLKYGHTNKDTDIQIQGIYRISEAQVKNL